MNIVVGDKEWKGKNVIDTGERTMAGKRIGYIKTSMDYKLAKELEEAGLKLPIDKHRKQWRVNWEVKKSGRVEEAILVIGENYETKGNCDEGPCGSYLINIPTLSELIEACGEVKLIIAINGYSIAIKPNPDSEKDNFRFEGESPKIATAKLFIALKK